MKMGEKNHLINEEYLKSFNKTITSITLAYGNKRGENHIRTLVKKAKEEGHILVEFIYKNNPHPQIDGKHLSKRTLDEMIAKIPTYENAEVKDIATVYIQSVIQEVEKYLL